MRASVASYRLHKGGGSESEYEDAFTTMPDTSVSEEVDVHGFGIAISDGASESILAGRWADLLVRHFAPAIPEVVDSAAAFADHAVLTGELWDLSLGDYIAEREAQGRPVQWYEQPKLERGAFATLLILGFTERSQGHAWAAAGIGDCALFHVRGNELVTAFPMTSSAEFGTNPALLNSRNRDRTLIADRVGTRSGALEQQDDIYVCTDAVAAWFLNQAEQGGRPWETLKDLDTIDGLNFADFIHQERAGGRMRNDDATLIHVAVW